MADGFHARGSFEEWRTIVGPALEFPRVKFVLLAGLAAPLVAVMAPWGAKNFVVDVCGESSKGKTTSLRLAASAWGNPDEDSKFSAITSWNSTQTGGERRASILNGIPLLKDDTKKVKETPWVVSQFIYDFVSGRGRERGTIRGLAATSTYQSTMIITGETRATSMSGDGGTHARVLTLLGLPFDSDDNATCQLVLALGEGIRQHYGHAGPRLVEYIIAQRDDWPVWGELYKFYRDKYIAAAEGNSVLARQADALALITLAGEMAGEALGMPQLAISPIDSLLPAIKAQAQDADRATQAMWTAWNYACSHPQEFFPNNSNKFDCWTGHWDRDSNWAFLGFLPEALAKVLTSAGFNNDESLLAWRGRGWLLIDKSDRQGLYHQAVIDSAKPRLVAIKREALRGAGCDSKASNVNDRLRKDVMALVMLARESVDPDLRKATELLEQWVTNLNKTAIDVLPSGVPTAALPTPAAEITPLSSTAATPASADLSPSTAMPAARATPSTTPAEDATG